MFLEELENRRFKKIEEREKQYLEEKKQQTIF